MKNNKVRSKVRIKNKAEKSSISRHKQYLRDIKNIENRENLLKKIFNRIYKICSEKDLIKLEEIIYGFGSNVFHQNKINNISYEKLLKTLYEKSIFDKDEIRNLVEIETKKYSNIITKENACFIIADKLDIKLHTTNKFKTLVLKHKEINMLYCSVCKQSFQFCNISDFEKIDCPFCLSFNKEFFGDQKEQEGQK